MSGLYGYRWQRARAAFLRANPLCTCDECTRLGRVRAAEVVDHDPPHRGDPAKFWDVRTWRALAKRCHDSWKQRVERGSVLGCDERGVPLDRKHHWHASAPEGYGGLNLWRRKR